MKSSRLRLALVLLVVNFAGVVYFLSLPEFFQGGDTAELVAAAYRRFVPHPPGYPLWIWVEHVWTHLIPFQTVFWRASLLSSLFALTTLFTVGMALRKNSFAVFLCLPFLAFSTAFREAAVLPDVFSLHSLIVATMGSLFLFEKPESSLRSFLIPFLFFIGFAHHPTIVFLFPVVIWLIKELWNYPRQKLFFALGSSTGVTAALLFYWSLLGLNPQSPFSWGNLGSMASLWNHFLRQDYGIFRLAPNASRLSGAGFSFFLKTSFAQCLIPLIVGGGWCALSRRGRIFFGRSLFTGRLLFWLLGLGLSFIFLLGLNVTPVGMGQEILLRFHLMPVLQVYLLLGFVLMNLPVATANYRLKALGGVLLAINLLWLLHDIPSLIALKKDSVFEEYSRNLLRQAKNSPTLILTENDNIYFGTRYLQSVMGNSPPSRPSVGTGAYRLFLHPWFREKMIHFLPQLDLSRIQGDQAFDLEYDLILPNLKKLKILVTRGFQHSENLQVTFRELGRELHRRGEPALFQNSEPPQLQTRYSAGPSGPQSFSRGLLYSQYSHRYLAEGLEEWNRGNKKEARHQWIQALQLVPYNFPALDNLCRSSPPPAICTPQNLNQTKIAAQNYF